MNSLNVLNLFSITGHYVSVVLLFHCETVYVLFFSFFIQVFLKAGLFSVFANSILAFYRFTGRHPGCGPGFQCTYGTIQDPVPDPGLVSLLDYCSWYVHTSEEMQEQTPQRFSEFGDF